MGYLGYMSWAGWAGYPGIPVFDPLLRRILQSWACKWTDTGPGYGLFGLSRLDMGYLGWAGYPGIPHIEAF